ncbi:MAG: DUF192 domain-containing protein [Candidatus Paceibacteria bacterium]
MSSKYSFLFLFGLLVVAGIVIGYLFVNGFSQNSYPSADYAISKSQTSAHKPDLDLTYATTPKERYTGLSNTKELSSDEGLMLVYDSPDTYGIVMRKMNFPIDIIWLDSDGTIVDIKHHAKPSSYQSPDQKEVFTPQKDAQFVLEVPAGTSKQNNWNIGTSLQQYLPE